MQIRKTNYSKGKWRLFTDEGKEVYTWQNVESAYGTIRCKDPICGDTKEQCVSACLSILENMLRES